MGTTSHRAYDRDFKVEAARLYIDGDRTAKQVADDLGISVSNLRRWKKTLEADARNAFPGRGRLGPDDEAMRQLRRENEVLRQERDILKKALAIFSKPLK